MENSSFWSKCRSKMTAKRIIFTMLSLVLLLGIAIPYGKVEFLTATHGDEFVTGHLQTRMIDEIEYLKVMKYSPHEAEVYYVEEGKTAGHLIEFTKDDAGNWKYVEWATVWSMSGSASGFIWPYYR